MVLNRDKSKEFIKIKGNINIKKGLLAILLGGTLMLSGCGIESVQENAETVNNDNSVVVTEAPIKDEHKVYAPGEHRVFVCRKCNVHDFDYGDAYLVSNIETPLGYQLVNTDYETTSTDHLNLARIIVINEYVNTVYVKVNKNIVETDDMFKKTSFGIPVEKEEEEEKNKSLTKNLQ